jgi:formylglycine-generating enzyme required for sulfatase activity
MNILSKARWALVPVFVSLANVGCAQPEDLLESIEAVMPEMIHIQGGTFKMGDMVEEGDANELPVHEVTVANFAIASHEVTFDLYDLFAIDTGRVLPSDEGWGRSTYPVTNVSWHDAQALVAWLSEKTGRSFRLPSEAEWEYMGRSGTDAPYPWGDNISREYANYGPSDCCGKGTGISGRDQWEFTAPVGSFEPSPWGLYDTAGNVWEWVSDCWNDSYEGAPIDGSSWDEGNCARSPLRGGSWTHYSRNIRAANRNDNDRTSAGNGYGIRLAEDI